MFRKAILMTLVGLLSATSLRASLHKTLQKLSLTTEKKESLERKFHNAAMQGDISGMEKLLALGIEPNMRDLAGLPVLISATIWKRKDVVPFLLSHGADPNIQSNDGRTALMLAAFNNHLDLVKLLLEHGANPLFQCTLQTYQEDFLGRPEPIPGSQRPADYPGGTALAWAKNQSIETFECIAHAALSHSDNKEGNSILHYAAFYNRGDLLRKILKK